jgi:hypothetical protein
MTINEQIIWLTTNTTIKWIERTNDKKIVAGTKNIIDRFLIDQGTPISFTENLEPLWQNKFNTLGNEWDINRQRYRLLYDSMKSFFISFIGMRINKISAIESRENLKEKLINGELAGSHLLQMYMSGKKAIDLIKKLDIEIKDPFYKKFCETRNKLFEHNHNAFLMENIILEPSVWEIISTKSIMTIYIHTSIEREFEGFLDYYQDYYDLEKIFVETVQSFIKKIK